MRNFVDGFSQSSKMTPSGSPVRSVFHYSSYTVYGLGGASVFAEAELGWLEFLFDAFFYACFRMFAMSLYGVFSKDMGL